MSNRRVRTIAISTVLCLICKWRPHDGRHLRQTAEARLDGVPPPLQCPMRLRQRPPRAVQVAVNPCVRELGKGERVFCVL